MLSCALHVKPQQTKLSKTMTLLRRALITEELSSLQRGLRFRTPSMAEGLTEGDFSEQFWSHDLPLHSCAANGLLRSYPLFCRCRIPLPHGAFGHQKKRLCLRALWRKSHQAGCKHWQLYWNPHPDRAPTRPGRAKNHDPGSSSLTKPLPFSSKP